MLRNNEQFGEKKASEFGTGPEHPDGLGWREDLDRTQGVLFPKQLCHLGNNF